MPLFHDFHPLTRSLTVVHFLREKQDTRVVSIHKIPQALRGWIETNGSWMNFSCSHYNHSLKVYTLFPSTQWCFFVDVASINHFIDWNVKSFGEIHHSTFTITSRKHFKNRKISWVVVNPRFVNEFKCSTCGECGQIVFDVTLNERSNVDGYGNALRLHRPASLCYLSRCVGVTCNRMEFQICVIYVSTFDTPQWLATWTQASIRGRSNSVL